MSTKLYTIHEIAADLGVTVQAANKYRRKAEKTADRKFGQPDPDDNRRTLYTHEEYVAIFDKAPPRPNGLTEPSPWGGLDTFADDAEAVEGELLEATDLVPLDQAATVTPGQLANFDHADTTAVLAELRQNQGRAAQGFNALLTNYATARMGQAIAEIDQTIETVKTNALGAALGEAVDGAGAGAG
jgi:hypothetical protein